MSDTRDRFVTTFCNLVLRAFASKEYNRNLDKTITIGKCVLDAAVIQEKKTPKEPFAIQVGFNGHTRIATLTKMYNTGEDN